MSGIENTHLLSNQPWDEISSRSDTLGKLFENNLLGDVTLQRDLKHDEWLRQGVLFLRDRRQKNKEMMGWGVRHELKVVRRVFVV